jgi:hypothetical protein
LSLLVQLTPEPELELEPPDPPEELDPPCDASDGPTPELLPLDPGLPMPPELDE